MGSFFLSVINLGLSFYCIFSLLKFMVQFGLPYHPLNLLVSVVLLSVTSFFSVKALLDFGLYPNVNALWIEIATISGSLGFLIQVILLSLNLNIFLEKILSRIPIIGAILAYSFFPDSTMWFFMGSILISVFVILFFVKNARYEKRILIKMVLFLSLFGFCLWINTNWSYIIGQLMLFPALFYFFIFEHSCGVKSLVQE